MFKKDIVGKGNLRKLLTEAGFKTPLKQSSKQNGCKVKVEIQCRFVGCDKDIPCAGEITLYEELSTKEMEAIIKFLKVFPFTDSYAGGYIKNPRYTESFRVQFKDVSCVKVFKLKEWQNKQISTAFKRINDFAELKSRDLEVSWAANSGLLIRNPKSF